MLRQKQKNKKFFFFIAISGIVTKDIVRCVKGFKHTKTYSETKNDVLINSNFTKISIS